MLSNREKELVTLAYYQGSADNYKLSVGAEKFETLDKAVIESSLSVLEELGLRLPQIGELEDFFKEMEEITLYLCKESNRWGVNYVAKHNTFKGTHTVGDLVSIVLIVILWVESLEVVRLKIMQDEELCKVV